jgi:hypothetical protein
LAFCPEPRDGATDVQPAPILRWVSAEPAFQHDIYFGDDRNAVTNATSESSGVYRGRQPPDVTTYEPGVLKFGETYYWRIDEVDETDPNSPWKGHVWSFTTANIVVVDDFESYNDEDNRIYKTWIDGFVNGTGSTVSSGDLESWVEWNVVHGGRQSMWFYYDNEALPHRSEVYRTWGPPQDWTRYGADTLMLYFHGDTDNAPDPLYVGLEDGAGRIAVVVYPDPNTILTYEWTMWDIPVSTFGGISLDAVKTMYIGLGDRDDPQPGGRGRIWIDDIGLYRLSWAEPSNFEDDRP